MSTLDSKNCQPPEFVVLEQPCGNSQILDQGDCTYIHISGDGQTTSIIDTNPKIDIVDNCDGTFTFSWKGGNSFVLDINKIVEKADKVDLTLNPNGTLTFVNGKGEIETYVLPASRIQYSGGGLVNHIASDGTVEQIDICQIVIDNCSDELIANPDGSFTHRSISGEITIVPPPSDTGTEATQATSAFITTNLIPLNVGDWYLQLPNGQTWA